jgi:hypothetical protein
VFQFFAGDGIFRTVMIAVQIFRKLFLEHVWLLSGRFPGKKGKAKKRKNRVASCLGKRPCFD